MTSLPNWRLLEVDGSNLRGVTHQQAVECLKRTEEVVSLLLEREPTIVLEPKPDPPCPPSVQTQPPRTEVSMETTLSGRAKDYSFVTDENIHEVVLKKSLTGLGFSFYITQLSSASDKGSLVRIKRLFPGQPAQESGLLREGDVILSVNNEPVKDLSYQRVLFLLRGAPSEVHLLICRPGPGPLCDVDDNTLSCFMTFLHPCQSPIPTRETRSRSLDIRLGEDYSQLLKFQFDANIPTLIQPCSSNQEENANNQSEKNSSRSPAPADQDGVTLPSPPRSPPKHPTSPPSPITPPSPPSPPSPLSPLSPVDTEPTPATGPADQHPEEPTKERNVAVIKRDVRKTGSHVTIMDVCPKSTSDSVYTR
uniref:PDZ domain-containing protein n=1 Tax=Periophthalmus magnuspinnatus TaxID=409849 RepID=A0A3B4B9B0_9GOBI